MIYSTISLSALLYYSQVIVKDNLNPDYADPVIVDYMFEMTQEFVIKVFHCDGFNPTSNEAVHTFIGEVSYMLTRLYV